MPGPLVWVAKVQLIPPWQTPPSCTTGVYLGLGPGSAAQDVEVLESVKVKVVAPPVVEGTPTAM
jgi:hypothetical protein